MISRGPFQPQPVSDSVIKVNVVPLEMGTFIYVSTTVFGFIKEIRRFSELYFAYVL